MPSWRDRIAPGPPPLNWTKERDGSWSALSRRFRVIRVSDEQWALEDGPREPRLVGMYATCPLAQGVAGYRANETGNPKKEGREGRRKLVRHLKNEHVHHRNLIRAPGMGGSSGVVLRTIK